MGIGVISQFFLLLSGILSARMLGPEGRGIYALIILFPTVLAQVGAFGMPQAVVFFLSRNPGRLASILRSIVPVFIGQVTLSVIALGLMMRFDLVGQGFSPEVIGLGILATIPSLLVQRYGMAVFQGLRMFGYFNALRLLNSGMMAITMILLYGAGVTSFVYVVIGWVIVQNVTGAIVLLSAFYLLPYKRTDSDFVQPISPLVRFGVKGMLGFSSPLGKWRLDQLIIGLLLPPASLGIYVVGRAFTNLPALLSNSVSMITFPVVAGVGQIDRARFLVYRFLVVTGLVNVLLVSILVYLMPTLVKLLFGLEFMAAVPVARILMVGSLFYAARRIINEGSRGMGHPQISTIAEIVIYPLMLILGLASIPSYGIIGVALTVSTSQFVSFMIALILFRNIRSLLTAEKT